jgi:hypothetical protein
MDFRAWDVHSPRRARNGRPVLLQAADSLGQWMVAGKLKRQFTFVRVKNCPDGPGIGPSTCQRDLTYWAFCARFCRTAATVATTPETRVTNKADATMPAMSSSFPAARTINPNIPATIKALMAMAMSLMVLKVAALAADALGLTGITV